jgi:DNA invertase Pin-like site-specific DNA recombinase
MIYGYARCSTKKDTQDIKRQERELKRQGAMEIYNEFASGTDEKRNVLMQTLARMGAGDTLVCTEPSRLSRSLQHMCSLIEIAKVRRFKLQLGALKVDFTDKPDYMALAMMQIMAVFGELEVNQTKERIASGLENAKAKGSKLGRPKLKISDVPKKVRDMYNSFLDGNINKAEYARNCGISRSTLYRYLRLLQDENRV